MEEKLSLPEFIYNKLKEARWRSIALDKKTGKITCPQGSILFAEKSDYRLKILSYSFQTRQYSERGTYSEIVFPKNFNIREYLLFKYNGNYKLKSEKQFKKIASPFHRNVKKIKLVRGDNKKGLYNGTLLLSIGIFKNIMKDAENVQNKSYSYQGSAENYLSNIAASKYNRVVRNRTTYVEKGEFQFLVDRLNLRTKKDKRDFQKYLDSNDLKSLETLINELFKKEALSTDFMRRLDDYFIKEKLRDIIALGKDIIKLGTTNLETESAKKIVSQLGEGQITQLEALWQKYFQKYLLYLIFSYKKIFPKVELNNIEGDKKYPDFIGVNHYNGLDIIEIKTHLTKILVWDGSHENFYFSPEMSKAIVQTTNYLDAIVQERFRNSGDKQNITNFVDEENLYHPRGIIIISSSRNLTTKNGESEKLKRDFTKLRNGLHNIQVITFDEILNIADEYIKNIITEESNGT